MSDQPDLRIFINDKLTDIAELKVTELKVELKKRGVSTAGTKKDLYEKLKNVCIFNLSNKSLWLWLFYLLSFKSKYIIKNSDNSHLELITNTSQIDLSTVSDGKLFYISFTLIYCSTI